MMILTYQRKVFEELKKKKELFTSLEYYFDGKKTLFTKSPINMETNILITSVTLSQLKKHGFHIRIIKFYDPKHKEIQKRIYDGEIVTIRRSNIMIRITLKIFKYYQIAIKE